MMVLLGATPFFFLVPYFILKDTKPKSVKKSESGHDIVTLASSSEKLNMKQLKTTLQNLRKMSNASENAKFNDDDRLSQLNEIEEKDVSQNMMDLIAAEMNTEKKEQNSDKNFASSFLYNLHSFYHIPAIKFQYHVLSHVIFILLFSYVLMADFNLSKISRHEMLVYSFLIGFFLEEVREFVYSFRKRSLRHYITSKWNVLDWLAISLSIAAFFVRIEEIIQKSNIDSDAHGKHYKHIPDDFKHFMARVLLSASLLLFYLRLLFVLSVLESMGPKLKMISNMVMGDLLPFLSVLFIFMFAFGVVFHSLLYPNAMGFVRNAALNTTTHQKISASTVVKNIIALTFYTMLGDYQLDKLKGGEACEIEPCPDHFGSIVVPNVFMIIYIVITNILLLNLLIALFSKTVDQIQSRSRALWQFERYDLVQEFLTRSALPPPLNILDIIKTPSKLLLKRFCKWKDNSEKRRIMNPNSVLYFLLYQAFALRGQRNALGTHLPTDGRYFAENPAAATTELLKRLTAINERLHSVDESVQAIVQHTRCTEEQHNLADVTTSGANCGLRRATMINAARGLRDSMTASFMSRRSNSFGSNHLITSSLSVGPRLSTSESTSA